MAESSKSKKCARIGGWFGSTAAEKAYHDQTVLAERGVKVSDLTDPKFSFIPQIFESRGWKSLVSKSVNPYVALASSSILREHP